MERRTVAAFAVAAAMFAAALAVGVLAPAGSTLSAEAVLARSAEVMADESFTLDAPCEHCDEPTVIQYAPPDRIFLASGSPSGDNWPYYLYLNEIGYFSLNGVRWRSEKDLNNAWYVGYQRMVDPRTLLTVVTEAELRENEQFDGRETRVVSGGLDLERMLLAIPEEMRPFTDGPFSERLRTADVTFWIDAETHRLLQLRLVSRLENFGESTVRYDFEAPVTIPESVESMDAEEANAFSEDIERGGTRLLRAIGAYHRAKGAYPPELTPETIGPFLPAAGWPANAFTGEPVRHEPDTPGNFDYKLIADGRHIQFQIDGWDGSFLYFDTERFGPIPETVGRLGE